MATASTTPAADSFERLVAPLRPELHAHCYRMLGSLHDAEDAFQEAMLRAWRHREGLSDRGALRAWLYKIATNVCLDAIKRRQKRVLPVDYGPPSDATWTLDDSRPVAESVWVEPYPDEELGLAGGYASPEATYEQREAIELAFVATLQHLPAGQRASLILREVLGYSARETAEALETSVASVNSSLQRARKTLAERLPERSQQETIREMGDDAARRIAEAYMDAWSNSDFDALRAILAEDAIFSMPPEPAWWRGSETIMDMQRANDCPESRGIPMSANGQFAFGWYSWNEEAGKFLPSALELITLEGGRVAHITAFVKPSLHARFGLPKVFSD